jgi:hypothetical protein
MYSTKSLNGFPAIQLEGCDGSVAYGQYWKFALDLCELLKEIEAEPPLLLHEYDRLCPKAMDRAVSRKVQHA